MMVLTQAYDGVGVFGRIVYILMHGHGTVEVEDEGGSRDSFFTPVLQVGEQISHCFRKEERPAGDPVLIAMGVSSKNQLFP